MNKVNAHYERIDPREQRTARNSAVDADLIVMWIIEVYFERIDPRYGVFRSISRIDRFITRIYFAHVFGVTNARKKNDVRNKILRGKKKNQSRNKKTEVKTRKTNAKK